MIYFIYFVFKRVQRFKIFKWCSKFLLNDSFIWVVKIFKQKVLSAKVYWKEFFLFSSSSFTKDFQKLIKSLPNWIQIPAPIHFCSLGCHQGISVPRMVVEIESYLVVVAHLSSLINLPLFLFGLLPLPKCYSWHVKVTFMWSAVDAPIHISRPYNRLIISGSVIHYFFPPSHSIEFKRSYICSTYQFCSATKPQIIALFSII
jgi:hypothetical protein